MGPCTKAKLLRSRKLFATTEAPIVQDFRAYPPVLSGSVVTLARMRSRGRCLSTESYIERRTSIASSVHLTAVCKNLLQESLLSCNGKQIPNNTLLAMMARPLQTGSLSSLLHCSSLQCALQCSIFCKDLRTPWIIGGIQNAAHCAFHDELKPIK